MIATKQMGSSSSQIDERGLRRLRSCTEEVEEWGG